MSISVCPGCASKCAVCHASGATHAGVHACKNCRNSKNLGMKCPVCGHNYRRHFGPLKSLAPGDRVTFTDADGNLFAYDVAEIQVLKPTAIGDMVSEEWDLSLFTCTLGGQTRLTVRCEACEE